jgi:hypothetical protein
LGQHSQQDIESLSRWLLQIEQNMGRMTDPAIPTRQIAKGFLANAIAQIASQLQRFFKQSQCV